MAPDAFILQFLENAVSKATENIRKNGHISMEDAIPLILKQQFNHIKHLQEQMATKKDLTDVADKMVTKDDFAVVGIVKAKTNWILWLISLGFTTIGLLLGYITYISN